MDLNQGINSNLPKNTTVSISQVFHDNIIQNHDNLENNINLIREEVSWRNTPEGRSLDLVQIAEVKCTESNTKSINWIEKVWSKIHDTISNDKGDSPGSCTCKLSTRSKGRAE